MRVNFNFHRLLSLAIVCYIRQQRREVGGWLVLANQNEDLREKNKRVSYRIMRIAIVRELVNCDGGFFFYIFFWSPPNIGRVVLWMLFSYLC